LIIATGENLIMIEAKGYGAARLIADHLPIGGRSCRWWRVRLERLSEVVPFARSVTSRLT